MQLSSFLALLGTIPSYFVGMQSELKNQQTFADYSIGQESPVVVVDTPLPQENFDLDALAQDFVLETKQIIIPGHPNAFNPSIIRWKGSLLMSFRSYDPQTRSTNPIGLVWLDEAFNPISEPQMFAFAFTNPVLMSKQQDPRLIAVGGRLFLVYNNIKEDVTHREIRRMYLVELLQEGKTFQPCVPECLVHFENESETRFEKNWVPIEYKGQLYLGYSVIPHTLLQPIPGTQSCKTAYSTNNKFPWNWGTPRGGTQAVLDGDHYIAFFHSWCDVPTVQSAGKKISHYVMGAYTFEATPPFALISASPEPIVAKDFYGPPYYKTWKPLRCVFPAGVVLDKNFIWVAYGRQDHEVWVVKIDKKRLLDSLVPISSP